MSDKISRLKQKSKATATVVAQRVAGLQARFNLRRVLNECDQAGRARGAAECEAVHHFLGAESRIAEVPFWPCLTPAEQRQLCAHFRFVAVPPEGPPATFIVDPSAPGWCCSSPCSITKP